MQKREEFSQDSNCFSLLLRGGPCNMPPMHVPTTNPQVLSKSTSHDHGDWQSSTPLPDSITKDKNKKIHLKSNYYFMKTFIQKKQSNSAIYLYWHSIYHHLSETCVDLKYLYSLTLWDWVLCLFQLVFSSLVDTCNYALGYIGIFSNSQIFHSISLLNIFS